MDCKCLLFHNSESLSFGKKRCAVSGKKGVLNLTFAMQTKIQALLKAMTDQKLYRCQMIMFYSFSHYTFVHDGFMTFWNKGSNRWLYKCVCVFFF